MKKIQFLILSLMTVGCSTMYIPPSQNVPLFEKKNEGLVEAGVSTNSVHISGAYAFSDKFAVTVHGNMSFHNFSKWYDVLNKGGTPISAPSKPYEPFLPPLDWLYFIESSAFSHRYVEAGLGRYNLRPSSVWKMELFAGAGFGYAEENQFDYYFSGTGMYRNKYWLGFVQGNLGKKWRGLEYGYSLRMAYSGFCFTTPSEINPYYPYYPYLNKDLYFNNIHLEPFAFLRGRLVKFNTSSLHGFAKGGLSFSYPLKSFSGIYLPHGIERERMRYTIWNFALGVSYRF